MLVYSAQTKYVSVQAHGILVYTAQTNDVSAQTWWRCTGHKQMVLVYSAQTDDVSVQCTNRRC